jgi:hypothetical protein
METFDLASSKPHTTCITEVQKFQGKWQQKKTQPAKPAETKKSPSLKPKQSPKASPAAPPAKRGRACTDNTEVTLSSVVVGTRQEFVEAVAGVLKERGTMSEKDLSRYLISDVFVNRVAKSLRKELQSGAFCEEYGIVFKDGTATLQ